MCIVCDPPELCFLCEYMCFLCEYMCFLCEFVCICVNLCVYLYILCVIVWFCVYNVCILCIYASQIRVPVCIYASQIRVPNWRPRYASQIDVPIRVPNELFIKVQFGVPTCSVCSCASQTTRPELRVQIRVPTTECCILCAIRVPTLCIRVPTFVYASQLCV